MEIVGGKDLRGDVYLVDMHEVGSSGVVRRDSAVCLTADGSFTADQAEAFGQACLAAARLLREGLAGE